MKSCICILTYLLISGAIHAGSYYVSPSGNDLNNGTSPSTAWKTIAKINNFPFLPGDVVLFQRGGIWRETLRPSSSGLASKPITFSSYGTGAKPIINGAEVYKGGWTASTTPGTWSMTSPIANDVTPTLMMDGAILDRASTPGGLKDKQFYIDKKSKVDKIFIYSASNPNNRTVEISTRDYGIYISRKSYINISQLTVINCLIAGISFDGNGLYSGKPNTYFNGYSVIEYITVANSVKYGIVTGNGYSYTTIRKSSSYSNGNGFYADGNADHTLFQNDTAFNNYSQTDPFTDGNGFGVYKSSFNTVENCLAYNNKSGNGIEIDLNGTDSAIVIRYNKAYGNGLVSEGYGIKTGNLAGQTSSNLIYYNLSYLNGNDPVDKIGREFYHHYGNISFYNNTAYTTGTDAAYAITLGGNGTVIIKNNIFYSYGGESGRCIRKTVTSVLNADNNLYYTTAENSFYNGSTPCNFNAWQKLGYDKSYTQQGNALFMTNGSNFILQAISPAINKGTPVGLKRDILGNPISGLPDVGAFEKINASTPPANKIPIANAGADKVITLPVSSVTLNGKGSDSDGHITGYLWKQLTGPALSTLSATTTPDITATKLVKGIYKFALTVKDNQNATGVDTVTITVNAAPNSPPVANAGPNRTITLPTNAATLDGSVSSDANGHILSYQWQQTSGPSASLLSSASAAIITVSKLIEGVYVFKLTIRDNESASASATVSVTVKKKPNQAPIAKVSNNFSITLPQNTATLSAAASSDPDGTITNYLWQQIRGPSASTISSTSGAVITVSKLIEGVYSYQLLIKDNAGASASATVSVTVNRKLNQVPTANAGSNLTITLPKSTVSLSAAGSSDADGTITNYLWEQISGPSPSIFSSTSGAGITVSKLIEGVYSYKLTVRDNEGAIASANVSVTVKRKLNQAPTANAGSNRTVTLPTNTITLSAAESADPDGTITRYQWQQVSGPSAAVFSSVSAITVNVSSLKVGVYQFKLTVKDNDNAISTATVIITVNKASNKPPVAVAGEDQTLDILNNYTTLDGGKSTDSDGVVSSYSWQQVSGPGSTEFSSPTGKTIRISNLVAGQYTYELTVTDNEGATARRTVNVTVADNFINITGPVVLYPNPASDVINIRFLYNMAGRIQITVVDITGKKILPNFFAHKPATPYSIPVEITKLPRGAYVISALMTGQKVMSATFLKL